MIRDSKWSVPLGEVETLIRKICELEVSYPVVEMDRLIEIGRPAVLPIIQVLDLVEDAPKPEDVLPFLVILGEIRSPAAVDILIKFMLDVENDILANAACEALEKIVTENKNSLARLYAYGALGYMKHPLAHEVLRSQLTEDPELVNVIVTALSEYGDRKDIEAIYSLYRHQSEDAFNPDMEEAIYLIANPSKLEPTPAEENWRIRYRRLPACGDVPRLSALQIAAIIHQDFLKNRALVMKRMRREPKRELDEIISNEKDKYKYEEDQYCPNCGEKIAFPAGLPVCSEIAYKITLLQEAIIRSYLESGVKTVPDALDMLDNEAKKIGRRRIWFRKRRREEEIGIKYATLNFFLKQKEYRLEKALEKLSETQKRLKEPQIKDRRATEKVTSDLTRLIRNKEFTSIDDANRYLKETMDKHGGRVPATPPRNALESAQDIMYEAWDREDKQERTLLARKALAISPDCADAYVLLAEETAVGLPEAKKLSQKGVEAGERALGQEGFKEHAGHFWGVLETRPYMRARLGLVQTLWEMNEHEEALRYYREMLKLNPNDNQGIRYILVHSLARLSRYKELEDLLESKEYPDDCAPDWLYTKALLCFIKTGPSPEANSLLDKAKRVNPYVPDYLTGRKRIPDTLPETIKVGGEDEGYCYAEKFLPIWQRVPGAIDWLNGRTEGISPLGGVARNVPCPCGSGKKYKKCCGKTVH
ncbi:MAG: SEC-C metal-binding domain-containing protein [Candidatus Omnitrophota bacterium]